MYGNNYNGYYGAYYQPQMQVQRPVQQPIQQQQSAVFTDVKFLNKKEIDGYIPFANTSVLLIDRQRGEATIKSADLYGESSSRCFKFNEVNQNGEIIINEQPEYVSKKDFEQLMKEFNEFKGKFKPKENKDGE